jgi:hypothetical protein
MGPKKREHYIRIFRDKQSSFLSHFVSYEEN